MHVYCNVFAISHSLLHFRCNLFSLLVSCLISDDIVTSAAYTFLYSIGVYFYYYSKKFYFDVNEDSIIQVYILIRNVFLSLLLIVLMFYLLTDGYVVAGYRISGGRIANVLIIAPIIFLISCFISTTSYNNLTNKIAIVLSLFFLFEAFSRSTWWSTIFTTFLLYIKRGGDADANLLFSQQQHYE